ncbi:hypothetical protein PIB30_068189 [Stylosanthes scabra]|uniref:Uncharacterized protein n=1 Tax=Stylosanthes scabra TaxID=79078 RepID=A0ABU6VMM1_9FABA|nr:hypothetical protein [Stylosanthes scabra]
MEKSNFVPTLMLLSHKLTSQGLDFLDNPILYRSIVGGLQYTTLTHLEIAYAVNRMQPGQLILTIENLQVDIAFVLALILFFGAAENNKLLADPPQKQNIDGWQRQLLKLYGFRNCSKK